MKSHLHPNKMAGEDEQEGHQEGPGEEGCRAAEVSGVLPVKP